MHSSYCTGLYSTKNFGPKWRMFSRKCPEKTSSNYYNRQLTSCHPERSSEPKSPVRLKEETVVAVAMPVYCPSCEAGVDANAKFCLQCGHDLETDGPITSTGHDVRQLKELIQEP